MTTTLDTRLASYHSPVSEHLPDHLRSAVHAARLDQAVRLAAGTAVPVGTWPGWWAGLIEFVLGLLIVIGLFTRIAAFIASGEMAFAYFYQHWPPLKGGASASFWPHDQRLGGNGGELAIMFCFAFLLLATTGAGAWSIDARRRPVGTTAAAPRRRFGLRR